MSGRLRFFFLGLHGDQSFFHPFQEDWVFGKFCFALQTRDDRTDGGGECTSRDDDKQYCSERNMHRFDHCKHRCGSGRNGARGARNLACNDTARQGLGRPNIIILGHFLNNG